MPSSILSSLFSKPKFVVTNSGTSEVLWPNLKIVSVDIEPNAANSDHPMSVTQLSDQGVYDTLLSQDIKTTKIISPSKVRIEAIAPDLSTLENVIATFADETALIDITSKSVVSFSMAPVYLTVDQNHRMLTGVKVLLALEQAIPPSQAGFDPSQSADDSTNGIRIQSLPSSPVSVTSLVSKVTSLF